MTWGLTPQRPENWEYGSNWSMLRVRARRYHGSSYTFRLRISSQNSSQIRGSSDQKNISKRIVYLLNSNDHRVGLQAPVSADSSSDSARLMAAAAAPAAFFPPVPAAPTAARGDSTAAAGEESGDCPFRMRSCPITALASSRILITSPSDSVPAAPPVAIAASHQSRFRIRAALLIHSLYW